MQVLHSGLAPSHFSLAARQASQARETRRFLDLPPFSVSFEVAAAFRARRFCGMLGWESRPSKYRTCNQQSTREAWSGQKHDSRSCNGEFRRDCFAKINGNGPGQRLATSNWQLSWGAESIIQVPLAQLPRSGSSSCTCGDWEHVGIWEAAGKRRNSPDKHLSTSNLRDLLQLAQVP